MLGLKGASLADLRSVYSHVHALGQCRKIIKQYGLKAVTTGDTAGSAREVAEWGDKSRASLAPQLAADIYGLDVLARFVEDEDHNTTRFVILSREPFGARRDDEPMITTFVFRVRNVPSALYKALGGFATNGVNMTKLESYMVNGEFSATQFLVDVEGHPQDANLARALEELRFFSETVSILGAYPAHGFRQGLAGRPRSRVLACIDMAPSLRAKRSNPWLAVVARVDGFVPLAMTTLVREHVMFDEYAATR